MLELSASLQDYLEGVLFVQQAKGEARVADLAELLCVKKPSVVKSLTKLKELGLIKQEAYRPIILTVRGRAEAKKISRRHNVLKDFFTEILKIDKETAEQDACRMEHVISSKTFKQLTIFIEFCLSSNDLGNIEILFSLILISLREVIDARLSGNELR